MRASYLSLTALLAACPLASFSQADAPRVLNTRFTYKATVPALPAGAKNLRVWLPVPSDSELQTISNLKVVSPDPYQITRDRLEGNRMVYVTVDGAKAPYEISVTFDVARKTAGLAHVKRDLGADGRRYLGSDRLVPIDGRFAELGEEVAGTGRNAAEKMRRIYDHVVATMQYDYKKESPHLGEGDVAFVCDYKKGNCSDLHSYVISLARSQGVPAYLEYGFPVTGIPVDNPLKVSGNVGGYHCWTWFYDDARGWLPLDASDGRRWLDSNRADIKDKLVGELVLERSAVAFSKGRDIVLEPKQSGAPLNYFIYPYAEADGKPVEAKWALSYQLLGGDDLAQQVEFLRDLVMKQQAEIEALKAAKAGGASAVQEPSVKSQSGDKLTIYGFLRGDAIYDTQKPNNAQSPQWVTSGDDNEQFSLHPRLTRLGLDLAAGRQGPFDVTGKIEIDFQGGGSESRNTPRARHLYVQLKQGSSAWLVGQTWDLVSPLFPSPNDDTLMWNAGNTGDRRPQIRYTYTGAEGFNAAFALGLTGAVDAKDLDANGTRDGEDSGMPGFQARIGYKGPKFSLGLWGALAREETDTPVGGETRFETNLLGIDWQLFFNQLDLAGEVWVGENVSDLRGGIGQGVNTTTGLEIQSKGGWIELGYKPTPNYRVAVGFTKDDPSDSDIVGSGRLENSAFYLHNKWNVGSGVEVGLNYLNWRTDWLGAPKGKNNRFNFFLMRKF
jgi:transglutaminase-like putative cysteine protease